MRIIKFALTFLLTVPFSMTWAGSISQTAIDSLSQPDLLLARADRLQLASSTPEPSTNTQQNHVSIARSYKEPLFSANKFHKYMGIGAVIMGGVTALTAPDGEGNEGLPPGTPPRPVDDGFHQAMALTATTMAVLATASGFLFHFDDLSLSGGVMDPDNMHMALGLLGTLGYITAVGTAPENGDEGGSHSTAGILGGATMLLAIKLEW